jgi:hypothetical protein
VSLNYISKSKAEKLSGFRLDGRFKYFLWNGEVCINESASVICGGCSESGGDNKGVGCIECGYHGVSRISYPLPVEFSSAKRS